MKREKGMTTTPLDLPPQIHYGAPRDVEDQIELALASVRMVTGFLGASQYGTCESSEETEAAGLVLFRALEFLDELDFTKVTMKPEKEKED